VPCLLHQGRRGQRSAVEARRGPCQQAGKHVTPWLSWCMSNYSAGVNVDAFFVYTSAGDQEMYGRDVGGQGMLEIGM
jgi:hypothetical protein